MGARTDLENTTMRVSKQVVLAAVVACVMTGCSSTYYVVKDPQSGNEYYTTDVKRSGDKVTFKDARSRSTVSLSNSEVMQITADQFRAHTGAPD
jgi:ABC-type enterochelin transport system substrate-binding protein